MRVVTRPPTTDLFPSIIDQRFSSGADEAKVPPHIYEDLMETLNGGCNATSYHGLLPQHPRSALL